MVVEFFAVVVGGFRSFHVLVTTTKEAPLSVQSPRKHLDLGSSGEIQGNLCSLTENSSL